MSWSKLVGGLDAVLRGVVMMHHRLAVRRVRLDDRLARERLDIAHRQGLDIMKGSAASDTSPSNDGEPESVLNSPLAKRLIELGFTVNEDCFENATPARLGEVHLHLLDDGDDDAGVLGCDRCETAGVQLIEVVIDGEWNAHEAPVDDFEAGIVCPNCGAVLAAVPAGPTNGVFWPLMRQGANLLEALKEPEGSGRNEVLLAALDRRLGLQLEALSARRRSIALARAHLQGSSAPTSTGAAAPIPISSARASAPAGSASGPDDDPPAAS